MAEAGDASARALASSLRGNVTRRGLRGLAALAVHVAAAAPERMTDVFDEAAAGWLGFERDRGRPPALDPLPMTARWWRNFWTIVSPPEGAGRQRYPQQMMELAGEFDPGINGRMASAALAFPGVAEAAKAEIPEAYDVEWLAQFPPASVGHALSHQLLSPGSSATDPYWTGALPFLRHMPAPLNYINVHVIHSLPLWGLVAGYTSRPRDRVALGGFLMGQVGHHYSALASAVTLTTLAVRPPENPEVVVDSLLKGWVHGRETPPLIQAAWESLWPLPVERVREILQVTPFAAHDRKGVPPRRRWTPRIV